MSVAIRLYQNEEKHQKPLELSSILVPDDGRSERRKDECSVVLDYLVMDNYIMD